MNDYDHIVRRMVEAAGHATQSMGVGRVLGQIFAWLYFSPEPQSLDDLTSALGISKGSASMGVRQLEQWNALEKVWVKGSRKDYYQAKDYFGRIVKSAVLDLVGKRMETSAGILKEASADLQRKEKGSEFSQDDRFLREQIDKIVQFQEKAQGMWDSVILQMLLK